MAQEGHTCWKPTDTDYSICVTCQPVYSSGKQDGFPVYIYVYSCLQMKFWESNVFTGVCLFTVGVDNIMG